MTKPWRVSDLQAIADYAEDYIALFDLDGRHLFVNRAFARDSGHDAAAFIGKTQEEMGLPPELCRLWRDKFHQVTASGQACSFEFGLRLANGTRILESLLAPVKSEQERVGAISAILRDVTDLRWTLALRDAQYAVMRRMAAGAGLQELLDLIVRQCEKIVPRRSCCILLADREGRRLVPVSAPQLPAKVLQLLCRDSIGPQGNTCAASAFQRRQLLCSNIATDPGWAEARGLALQHGLRACWAQPILTQDGDLLGVFVMFHVKERPPYPRELMMLNEAALAAAIAIRHGQALDSLLETRQRFRALTENAANIVCVTDLAGLALYCSPAVETILGLKPEEVTGRNVYESVHPDDVEATRAIYRKLRDHVGSQASGCYRYRHKDGSWRVLETIAKSQLDHHGHFICVVSTRDVTEQKQLQDRLERAMAATDLGMWEWNVDSGEIYSDARSVQILERKTPEEIATLDQLAGILHPDDAERGARSIEAHLRGETPHYDIEYRVMAQDGSWKWVCSRGKVSSRDAQGNPVQVTGTVRDIHAQKATQEKLDRANKRLQLLLEATGEGVIGVDRAGRCRFVNPAATRLLGYAAEAMLGVEFRHLVEHVAADGAPIPWEETAVHRCLQHRQRLDGGDEVSWRIQQRTLAVEYSASPLPTEDSDGGAVLIFRDVGEKRRLALQLQHQALHDPLTGLVNRRGFETKLQELIDRSRTDGSQHALCYIDLDQFKIVNDTCGHVAGDELLRQLPQVMKPLVRGCDTLARLGGDEFGVLLPDCSLEDAARIARGLRDGVRAFRFLWQYRNFSVGASIGVAGISDKSPGIVAVLGAADTACYIAKEQGPNNVHVSYPHDLAVIRRRGEMRWVARLRQALEEERFRLHFQSIAAIGASGQGCTSHELLIRLLDSKGELVMPAAFLGAAERYQMMPAIDSWVIEYTARFLGSALAAQPELARHRFGINLCAESLRDATLLDSIQQALRRHRVPASSLYFEITETTAIANLGSAVDFIHGLRQLGCLIALDDFGCGMSSFSYLKHLPVDYVKIDGSFVKDIVTNPLDQSIVRAISSVAQQMGIKTIAEHVENQAIHEVLRGIGIDYVQGYGVARPRPLEEFPALTRPDTGAAAARMPVK